MNKLEVLCKKCSSTIFFVIKPSYYVLEDSKYWWCTDCIIKDNREKLCIESESECY